ncbi:MAG: hypothetical protein ACK417_10640 [Bacteroidia bacterium]
MKKWLPFILGLVLLGACKKDKPIEDNNVWLPQGLKDQFLFYPGTYWIVKELNTGFEDSIFVYETVLDTLPIRHPGSRDTIGYKERFRVTILIPFYGQHIEHLSVSADYEFQRAGHPHHYVNRRMIKNAAVFRQNNIYFYPEAVKISIPISQFGMDPEQMRFDTIYPTYALLDSVYSNVRAIRLSNDPSLEYQESTRYFAPGIGIIRWVVPKMGWDWVCERYHVVREAPATP